MGKRKLLFFIGVLLIVVSIVGRFVSIAHYEATGWVSSSYPFWFFSVVWGVLYCCFLWLKRLRPNDYPVLWLMGVIPVLYGLYVGSMMESF